jgi:hypothetical protein
LDIRQRIDSYTQRYANIAKLVKLLHSPLYKCRLSTQYKVLKVDRQGLLECILIDRRTRVVGYRLIDFAGGLIHHGKLRESIMRGRRTKIFGYRVICGTGHQEVTVFTQFLNIDNLIAEPPEVGDMLDRLQIAADFESAKKSASGFA